MGSIPHQDKHLSDKHDVSSVTTNKISYVFKNLAHLWMWLYRTYYALKLFLILH